LKQESKIPESIRQYLLGRMPEADLPPLDEQLLTDQAFYDELLIVEDELIDDYLLERLSQSERESFEVHFLLAPERQHKVRFARTLNKYISRVEAVPAEDSVTEDIPSATKDVPKPPPKPWYVIFLPSQNPILSYSLAAALVLIVGTAAWLVLRNRQFNGPSGTGQILIATLLPGQTRGVGDEVKRISISRDVGILQLRLQLRKAEYSNYSADLQTVESQSVYSVANLKAEVGAGQPVVVVNVPTKFLSEGYFRLKLSGPDTSGRSETIDIYSFRIHTQ
jgi:hypothetical protein